MWEKYVQDEVLICSSPHISMNFIVQPLHLTLHTHTDEAGLIQLISDRSVLSVTETVNMILQSS